MTTSIDKLQNSIIQNKGKIYINYYSWKKILN